MGVFIQACVSDETARDSKEGKGSCSDQVERNTRLKVVWAMHKNVEGQGKGKGHVIIKSNVILD